MNNFTVYTRPDDIPTEDDDQYWMLTHPDDPCDDCSHWLGNL